MLCDLYKKPFLTLIRRFLGGSLTFTIQLTPERWLRSFGFLSVVGFCKIRHNRLHVLNHSVWVLKDRLIHKCPGGWIQRHPFLVLVKSILKISIFNPAHSDAFIFYFHPPLFDAKIWSTFSESHILCHRLPARNPVICPY